MTTVRNHPEARWLPSRHHYALFRLYAAARLVRARTQKPADDRHVAMTIDRDQSTEHYVIAGWLVATTALYVYDCIPLHPLAAAPLTVVFTPLLLQIPAYITGGVILPRFRNNQKANTIATIGSLTLASLAFAFSDRQPRPAAILFLSVLLTNAIAATIAYLLRNRLAELERPYLAS
jgi:hypothetical protein